ncbi:hypothetical protein OFB79_26505, partial [Escherichia coli]|nr:hypothetical protein [Escherichia coli]
ELEGGGGLSTCTPCQCLLGLLTFNNTTFSPLTNEIEISIPTAGRNWNAMMIRGLGRSNALNIGLGMPVPAKWNENPT